MLRTITLYMLVIYALGLIGLMSVLVVRASALILSIFKGYLGLGAALTAAAIVGLVFPARQIVLEYYAGPFDEPVYALPDPTQPDRMYVLEREGVIRVVDKGIISPEPFLQLNPDHLNTETFTKGLLGMVFHPQFEDNGLFYIYFTGPAPHNLLMRFQVLDNTGNRADPNSGVILLQIDMHADQNHNGGHLLFGPDGYLYLTVGEGPLDTIDHSEQSLNELTGKILRLDVTDPYLPAPYYTIPPENPFAGEDDVLQEIWSYGLRNPWRMAFSTDGTHIYISDVGDMTSEEVNYLSVEKASGANFGWDWFEGNEVRRNLPAGSDPQDYIFPVLEYRSFELGCAIIGGYEYRGTAIPSLRGKYLHADYCNPYLWVLYQDNAGGWIHEVVTDSSYLTASLVEDIGGEIYVLRGGALDMENSLPGEMFKLVERWQFTGLLPH